MKEETPCCSVAEVALSKLGEQLRSSRLRCLVQLERRRRRQRVGCRVSSDQWQEPAMCLPAADSLLARHPGAEALEPRANWPEHPDGLEWGSFPSFPVTQSTREKISLGRLEPRRNPKPIKTQHISPFSNLALLLLRLFKFQSRFNTSINQQNGLHRPSFRCWSLQCVKTPALDPTQGAQACLTRLSA